MIRRAFWRWRCRRGHHDKRYSPSGLVGWCGRDGCGWYWEYD